MANLIGNGISQIPTNGMLGNLAFQDKAFVSVDKIGVGTNFYDTGTTNQLLQVGIPTTVPTDAAGAYISGSVGIGTTNPSSTLVVQGTVRVSGVVTAASFVGDGSGLTGIVATGSGVVIRNNGSLVGTAGTIDFGTNLSVSPVSAGVVTVTSSGSGGVSSQWVTTAAGINTSSNVGIGTTIPTSTLHVVGNGLFTGIVTASSFSGNASSATYSTSSGIATYATSSGVSTSVSGGIASVTSLNVSGISTLGNVSIGAGNTTLIVTGTARVSGAATFDSSVAMGSNLTASGNISFNNTASSVSVVNQTTGTITLGGPAQTGTIVVGQSTSTQTTNIQAGASGVGTTKTINFGTGGLSGSNTLINIGPSAGVGTVVINSGTNLLVGTTTATGTASQLLQVSGGAAFYGTGSNVGIGTTNPTSKLTVVGDVSVSGIITATGGFSGLWVSAKQYGTKGDGITIENTSIQTALNSLSPGGTLYIPPGTYLLDNSGISIPSNVRIVGAGISATYLKQNVALGSTSLLYASGQTNISIEHITFDGNNITNSNNSSLLYTPFSDNINVQNCAFIRFDQQGLFLNSSSHCNIKNNYFYRTTTSNNQNQALTVSYSNFYGPNTRLSYDIRVDSNTFINSGTIFACHSTVISNNYINTFGFGAGITIDFDPYYFSTGTRNVYNIIIDNNIVTGGIGTDINGYKCGGIELWSPYSKITNNTLYKNSGAGIDQGGLYCIVSNNTIYDNGINSPVGGLYGAGIAGRYSDSYHNSSYSTYVNNIVGLTTNYTGTGQAWGYEDQNYPTGIGASITQVSFINNNFSAFTGNKSGEMSVLGSNYTIDIRRNGNIGIGTTNPTSKLHVIGNARVSGVVTAASFVGDGSGLTGIVAAGSGVVIRDDGSLIGTAGTIDFGTNLSVSPVSAGVVTITGTGGVSSQWVTTAAGITTFSNVGIGTTNPYGGFSNKGLEVNFSTPTIFSRLIGTTGESGIWVADQDYFSLPSYKGVGLRKYGTGATGNTAGISNADLGALAFQNISNALIYTNGSTPLIFGTFSLERMRIDSNGNIGIGTNNPGSTLDVRSSTGTIRAQNYTANSSVLVDANINGPRVSFGSNADNSFMEFGAYNNINNLDTKSRDLKIFSTSASNALILKQATGNIGIGTDNPLQRLQVGATNPFVITSSGSVGIATSNPTNIFQVGSGSTVVLVDAQGEVGINTTNPVTPLQVERFGFKSGFGTFTASAGIATDIDTFTISSTDFKTSEYTLHIQNPSGMQAQKILVMQNGTTAYSQEYAVMYDSNLIVSVGSTISAGVMKLQVTPETGITGLTTYRFTRQTIL